MLGMQLGDEMQKRRYLVRGLAGYRHFDTALIYVLRQGAQHPVCRWNHHGRIGESLNESLEILGVDYVDLPIMVGDREITGDWQVQGDRCHQFSNQDITSISRTKELIQYCRAKGIVVVAYTRTALGVVRKDPVIIELADKCNATSTRAILAWHLARGVVAVPKSADEGRQKDATTLFVLEPVDVKRISGLDKNDRLCNKATEVNGTLWGWTYEQLGWA
ncbi:reductase AKOR2 [Armillaria novae-zelandiae]|uniref:Reductase AKOR2 n=1 Tax=Armillaria novae-zelandiae TaxID=153914 RepID=A0AA39NHB0_9AGAR|nr:reductase AKOR2 [Armillaria novae-zelandiae]